MNPFPLILSAPSGTGKTTIAKELLRVRSDVGYSVSCTTRPPRDQEEEGRDYYFLERQEFLERRAKDHFAESAEVHGNLYGTLRREVERVLQSGRHVMMDIDVQGATQFRRSFPSSVLVFVLPPSADVLLQRLRRRGTESRGELAARMISALHELRAVPEYEYVVVNDRLENAVARVSAVIDAEFVRRERIPSLDRDVEALVSRLERELDTDLPKE
ncbi:MAG: guanylate kinase [Anaerolineae bacterium]|nr:guanylate kinase [Gemmatimonadaceae bacterium]